MELNVQTTADYNEIIIHSDQRFCELAHVYDSVESFKDVRPEFIDYILDIDGVKSLTVDNCHINVTKTESAPWSMIYLQVQEILAESFTDDYAILELSLEWFKSVLRIEGYSGFVINGIPVVFDCEDCDGGCDCNSGKDLYEMGPVGIIN